MVERTVRAAPRALGRETVSRDADRSAGASEDPQVAKAVALLERRLPDLLDALSGELRRYFAPAHARERRSRNERAPSPARNGPSPSWASRGLR